MANRRMFSKDIVATRSFLEMPSSARALYYQLGVEADDDGFIDPYVTMLATKSQEDDLRILLAKGFVISFKSGVCVIRHWKQNNMIRKDRHVPTQYKEELRLLDEGENKEYFLLDGDSLATRRQPSDNQVTTNGMHSIGKDRLGKGSIGERETHAPTKKKFSSLSDLTDSLIQSIAEDYQVPVEFVQDIKENLELYCGSTGKRYKDYNLTLRNWVKKDRAKFMIEHKRSTKGVKHGIDASNI